MSESNAVRQLADKLRQAAEWAKSYADDMADAQACAGPAADDAIPVDLHNAIIALVDAAQDADTEASNWASSVGEPDSEDTDAEGEDAA
jgi:hypothetical protein